MKKILMGLLAVSATAFSAIDMNTPKDETNVFEFGGTGKIKITASVKSRVAAVKYAVFADTDGNWSGDEEDVWKLPTILLSQTPQLNKFGDDVPLKNVYVKKVNSNNNGIEEIPAGTNVKFKLVLDTQYTGITSNPFGSSGKHIVKSTALMSKASLTTLAESLEGDLAGTTITDYGTFEKNGKIYRTPNDVKFYSDANGVLKVMMEASPYFNNSDSMSLTEAKEIEKLFTNAQSFSEVKIEVTVE